VKVKSELTSFFFPACFAYFLLFIISEEPNKG
jgi:hypothetical protein